MALLPEPRLVSNKKLLVSAIIPYKRVGKSFLDAIFVQLGTIRTT